MLTKVQKGFYDWVIYQIYPRSFKDTNGDGIGDLEGIIEKLDYIKELGANAIWITPCYKSPNEDNGYDISDYCDISEEYGDLDVWKRLALEMHKRDMKLIMDFVANHTSSEHRWFQESRSSKENPYRDYYYWADEPLNEWESTFGGSVWEYDETTKQYYLHSYAVGQPDLNWENPKVREEMLKIIDFWVDLGADGFRCDVLDQISKDFEKGLKRNGPRIHEFINMLFGREKTKHIFTVGECWGADEDNIRLFVDGDRGELSMLFQFDHIEIGHDGKFEPVPFALDELRDIFIKWQEKTEESGLLYTLFWENHDTVRSLTRYGNDKEYRFEAASMLATMLYLQKGVPFIYQGQEIGIKNPYYDDIQSFDDIETHNYYNEKIKSSDKSELMDSINYGSRDNARHPMPWSGEKNGGFSQGSPWIALYPDYKTINAENDLSSAKSIYKFYQKLLELRKNISAFRGGKYENLTGDREGMYIYSRSVNDEKYIVVCNFENEKQLEFSGEAELLLANGTRMEISGRYKPYECAVYRLI